MVARIKPNNPWQFAPVGAGLATLAAAQGRYVKQESEEYICVEYF